MALEDLLAANTAALEANTAVLQKLYELKIKDVLPVGARGALIDNAKAVAELKKEVEKAEDVPAETVQETTTEQPEVTLQQLVAKFTDLVDFNRGAAVALLKEYGLPKLGQAKPEQYVEIFNKTCEVLNGSTR